MPPTAPRPDANSKPHATSGAPAVEGPPEEEFWEMYNRRLEFPLATVGAIFLHIVVFAAIVLGIFRLMGGEEDRSNPPLQLMHIGGLDDMGEGSAGSGGQADPDIERNVDPFTAAEKVLPTPQAIADAKENIKQIVLDDHGNLPVATPNAAAYSQLDDAIRKKLLGVGANRGAGNGGGKGFDDTKGTGPGGTGADSTRARGLRWVLRFRITGGDDYIAQLKAMGAEILVPLPPDNKKCLIIRDLANPRPVVATDADLNRLAGKIQFSDNRPQPVREVLGVLKVDAAGVKAFWAFFPKEVEEDLARKEKGYRNRSPEAIEETIFKVTIRGGSFETVVEDQVPKR